MSNFKKILGILTEEKQNKFNIDDKIKAKGFHEQGIIVSVPGPGNLYYRVKFPTGNAVSYKKDELELWDPKKHENNDKPKKILGGE